MNSLDIRTEEPPATASARLDLERDADERFAYDVAVVGLGYVGLPTALAYHQAGARVLGLDASLDRLDVIRGLRADLIDGDRVRLAEALGDDRLSLTADPGRLSTARAIVVCVPTPVDRYLVPDLTALRAACATAVRNAVRGQLLMLTSTTYVGCTDDLLVEPLARRGFVVGRDVYVAFSAERIDPGSELLPQEQVPRVVGATTAECEEEAATLLSRYAQSVHRAPSLAAAEMTKLLENTFRAVNIALANEFADICRALDIDVSAVISAAATKPYGFMPFLPGPGVGGHCIPCDPHYLLWQLRRERIEAPMISEAMTQIAVRPARVVERIRQELSDAGLGLAGARVLVLGVAYKPNVADVRESPAVEIIALLRRSGAEVAFVDPYVPRLALPDGAVLEEVADPVAFDATIALLHTRHAILDPAGIPSVLGILDGSYVATDLPARVRL